MLIRVSRLILALPLCLSLVLTGCDHHSSSEGDGPIGPTQAPPLQDHQASPASSPDQVLSPTGGPGAETVPDRKVDKPLPPACAAGEAADPETGLCTLPLDNCAKGLSWDAGKSHCLSPFVVKFIPSNVVDVVPGDQAANVGFLNFIGLDTASRPAEQIDSVEVKEIGGVSCSLHFEVQKNDILLRSSLGTTASRSCAYTVTAKTTAGRIATVERSVKLVPGLLSVKVFPDIVNALITGNDLKYINGFETSWNGTTTPVAFTLEQAADSHCQVETRFDRDSQLFLALNGWAAPGTSCRFRIHAAIAGPVAASAESQEFTVVVKNPELRFGPLSNDAARVVIGTRQWPVARVSWSGREEQRPSFQLVQSQLPNRPDCDFSGGFYINSDTLFLSKSDGQAADCDLLLKVSFRDGRPDGQAFSFKVKTQVATLLVSFPDTRLQDGVVITHAAWNARLATVVAKYLDSWNGSVEEPAVSIVKGEGCDGVSISLNAAEHTISAQGSSASEQVCSAVFVATVGQETATASLKIQIRNSDAKVSVSLSPNLKLVQGAGTVVAGTVSYVFNKINRLPELLQEDSVQLLQEDHPDCLTASLDKKTGQLSLAVRSGATLQDETCRFRIKLADPVFREPILSNTVEVQVLKKPLEPRPRPGSSPGPQPTPDLDPSYITTQAWRCAYGDDLSKHKIQDEAFYTLLDFKGDSSMTLQVRAQSDDHALMEPSELLNFGRERSMYSYAMCPTGSCESWDRHNVFAEGGKITLMWTRQHHTPLDRSVEQSIFTWDVQSQCVKQGR